MKREDLYIRSKHDSDELDKFISSLGGNLLDLMHKAGLEPSPPKSKIHFISWAGCARFFEIASRELNEPYLGLKWAFNIPKDYRTSGPTLFLGSIASDFRHFLGMVLEYQKIHSNGVSYNYQEDTEAGKVTGYIDIHPLSPPCRQLCEHIIATIAIMQRSFLPDFNIQRVTFQYDKPEDMQWYEKAFQCPVIFNAPRNTVLVDSSLMEIKETQLTTKFITPFVKTYFKWTLDRNPQAQTSISSTIVEILPELMGAQKTDINTIADTLDMHPKKLQRLLKDEGTNYKDILDDVRKSIAERLLVESDISITRMAKMLDYSSDRPFTAAFKRWFDMTPSLYRQQRRKGRHRKGSLNA